MPRETATASDWLGRLRIAWQARAARRFALSSVLLVAALGTIALDVAKRAGSVTFLVFLVLFSTFAARAPISSSQPKERN